MEYKSIQGTVYSRSALSPPVINSSSALKYGIRVPCMAEPGQYSGLEVDGNVKLRMVVDQGKKKMTCHAKVDWIEQDERSGQAYVGFGSLSLSSEEFALLLRNIAAEPGQPLQFGASVRDKAPEAEAVLVSETAKEIMRLKAVNFPVSIIEEVDEKRGEVPFSEFVVAAVKQYLKS
ncbi:MAG TPA: hypothetical protein VK463_21305 [Desulfomonilaceae bacterium]|nr:hypothetical protein [Desulfomonilaceae bacterium]